MYQTGMELTTEEKLDVTPGQAFAYEDFAARSRAASAWEKSIVEVNEHFGIGNFLEKYEVMQKVDGRWCRIITSVSRYYAHCDKYLQSDEAKIFETYQEALEYIASCIVIETDETFETFALVANYRVSVDASQHIPCATACSCGSQDCEHKQSVNDYFTKIAAIFSKDGQEAAATEKTEQELFEEQWNAWMQEDFDVFLGRVIMNDSLHALPKLARIPFC